MHETEVAGSISSDCSWPGALRRQNSNSSFCTTLSSSDDSPEMESCKPSWFNSEETNTGPREIQTGQKRRRPGLVKLYKSVSGRNEPNHAKFGRNDLLDSENVQEEQVDCYDREIEKMYGAPPGGRVFRFNDGKDDQGGSYW